VFGADVEPLLPRLLALDILAIFGQSSEILGPGCTALDTGTTSEPRIDLHAADGAAPPGAATSRHSVRGVQEHLLPNNYGYPFFCSVETCLLVRANLV